MLTFGFAISAISIHFTFDKNEILAMDARTIEQNLQKKEKFIKEFINNDLNFEKLKTLHLDPVLASRFVENFQKKKHILFYTYRKNQLLFWAGNIIAPTSDAGLREGSNRLKTRNGWYEAIRRTKGDYSVVGIIPIKAEYPYQNKYLSNSFSPDLIKETNLEIAGFNDRNTYNILNSDGNFVISVKLKSSLTNSFYSNLELWMVILSLVIATLFMHSVSIWLIRTRSMMSGLALLLLYFITLKALTLVFPVFSTYFNASLFNQRHFTGGYLFRSLGDFMLSAIMVTWLTALIYYYRKRIDLSFLPATRFSIIPVFVFLGLFLYIVGSALNTIFFNLITQSDINFDLSNILYLDMYSWIAILLIFVGVLNLYLLIEIMISVARTLCSGKRMFQTYLLSGLAITVFLTTITGYFNITILLAGLLIWIQWRSQESGTSTDKFLYLVIVLVLASIITSLKLSSFQFIKEREQRKVIAYKLESADDPNAVLLFYSIEHELERDPGLQSYFKRGMPDSLGINEKLRKGYFDGYLSRYELESYAFLPGKEDKSKDRININTFKNLVLAGSIKVSENFYTVNNTFGYQHYFGIIPVRENHQLIGTLIITLKSKTFKDAGYVPQVLVDNKMDTDKILRNYSFAFYLNDRLLNQNGKYIYSLNNTFPGNTRDFKFIESNGYNHLIYKPNTKKAIIVSLPGTTWIMKLASVSFLFLVMSTLTIIILSLHQLWLALRENNFELSFSNWSFYLPGKRILYRTRIQASLIGAILFTLMVVGIITYVSISRQFKSQLENDSVRKITRMSNGLENNTLFNNTSPDAREKAFHSFSSINAMDISLFDLKGRLLFTTQNKIYEDGFMEPLMSATAFINLSKFQQSEFLSEENVGAMNFIAAYKPIRNNRNETVAYLCLPYFSYQADYDELIGDYVNTLINVYALVLVTIALFTFFLANKITYPLTLVSKSLSEIKIDGKNESIKWNSNDEIGSLIKEYNSMILALEVSASKLARSERESAWREMAKQVAHEIKNPLTPLKLGVQLLEKSWKEQDPNFHKKFERFSSSFIEQIESLSMIASEFSNFAKLPDAPLENLDLSECIRTAAQSFQLQGTGIDLSLPEQPLIVYGSKDHLLKIFSNLLKNAVEAVHPERALKISLEAFIEHKSAVIKIKDEGLGISEELREKIFNPNFTTKSSGTGLGLSFVKQAVENMFGTISFITQTGRGTTFIIQLPLSETMTGKTGADQ